MNPAQLLTLAEKVIDAVGPEGRYVLGKLFTSIINSEDPRRAAERAAKAAAAKRLLDETLKKLLGRSKQ